MTDDLPPTPAASLILVRDLGVGPEVFLMVRDRGMAFASGAWVFPGGKVDAGDHDPAWTEWSDHADPDPALRAGQIAAIRETFEEAGVLFARRGDRLVNADEVLALLPYDGAQPLLDVVRAAGLRLACDMVKPFARWIGPRLAARRFDTAFFLGLVPSEQTPRQTSSETTHAEWHAPRSILEATTGASGERYLMFPTRSNLERLSQFETLDAILAHVDQTPVRPVQPEMIDIGGEPHLKIRDDQGYPRTVVRAADVPRG